MPLLDDVLKLLGTNRVRVQWKLRAWRKSWDQLTTRTKNQLQTVAYAHQVCPQCSHPAGADERVCSRCNEPLGGVTAQRMRRALSLLWPAGAPVVATVLVAAIVATYAATLVWTNQAGLTDGIGSTPSSLALDRFGGQLSSAIQAGEYWRLITGTFLHVDLLHLGMNGFSLWMVAVYLEEQLGAAKTFALYVILGVIASLGSFYWHTHTGIGVGNSVGASGAICGLIGVAVGFAARHRNGQREMRNRYLGWAALIAVMAFSSMRVDNAAHITGVVAGALIGLVVRRRADASGRSRRAWTVAAVMAGSLVIAAYVAAAMTPEPPEAMQLYRTMHDQESR